MKKMILLQDQALEYYLIRRHKSRHLRIVVRPDKTIWVSAPANIAVSWIEKFMIDKSDWILEKIRLIETQPINLLFQNLPGDYKNNKKAARLLINAKISHFNQFLRLRFNRVAVRNQTTRWGSCSTKKNLNFNYKIIYLPSELADYLVVHELCHLQEMNHSTRFWSLVGKLIPDYRDRRKRLRNYTTDISSVDDSLLRLD